MRSPNPNRQPVGQIIQLKAAVQAAIPTTGNDQLNGQHTDTPRLMGTL